MCIAVTTPIDISVYIDKVPKTRGSNNRLKIQYVERHNIENRRAQFYIVLLILNSLHRYAIRQYVTLINRKIKIIKMHA